MSDAIRSAVEIALAEHMRWPQAHVLDAEEAALWKVRRDELLGVIEKLARTDGQ
jgi:hypothetical protein